MFFKKKKDTCYLLPLGHKKKILDKRSVFQKEKKTFAICCHNRADEYHWMVRFDSVYLLVEEFSFPV